MEGALRRFRRRSRLAHARRGQRDREGERNQAPAAVALAWLLAKPTVSSVLFGARSLAQLDDNLQAADVKLSADEVRKLDDASAFELGCPYQFIAGVQRRW